jgi:ubiquinone/menaquinone biosynthesis C-methylase UbiE
MKKLNLGCGLDVRKGWVNLDVAPLKGVDVVHDLNVLPLPFQNEEFDHILCKDILEHFDYPPLLRELHRILREGGVMEICVPHFTSQDNFIDPTHKRLFSFQTFGFFVKGSKFERDYYFDFHFRRILSSKITFHKGFFFYNYLVEPLVNLGTPTKKLFEATFLSRLFPAYNILITLEK